MIQFFSTIWLVAHSEKTFHSLRVQFYDSQNDFVESPQGQTPCLLQIRLTHIYMTQCNIRSSFLIHTIGCYGVV